MLKQRGVDLKVFESRPARGRLALLPHRSPGISIDCIGVVHRSDGIVGQQGAGGLPETPHEVGLRLVTAGTKPKSEIYCLRL